MGCQSINFLFPNNDLINKVHHALLILIIGCTTSYYWGCIPLADNRINYLIG